MLRPAEAKAVFDNAYLVPKWEVALRREALIKNVHALTAIEGKPLSLEQVSELAVSREMFASSDEGTLKEIKKLLSLGL